MYTLNSWRSHLGIAAVELLHREPIRTVGNPSTAYVPGEVTHVLRMTMYTLSSLRSHRGIENDYLHPKFLQKSPGYRGCQPSAPGTR